MFLLNYISVCKHPAIVGLVASIASVIAIATKSIASATRCRCAYMRYVRSTFESTVGKNEKCAAVYNTAYGTQKQPCNSVNAYFFSYIHTISSASTRLVVGLVASIASVIAIVTKSIASATRCRCAYMRYVRSTFESTVGKNEKCAAVYNTAYGTHKQPCNSSARCLFPYIHSYPCASTLLLWIYEKTTSRLFARLFFRWCRRSDSNRHG